MSTQQDPEAVVAPPHNYALHRTSSSSFGSLAEVGCKVSEQQRFWCYDEDEDDFLSDAERGIDRCQDAAAMAAAPILLAATSARREEEDSGEETPMQQDGYRNEAQKQQRGPRRKTPACVRFLGFLVIVFAAVLLGLALGSVIWNPSLGSGTRVAATGGGAEACGRPWIKGSGVPCQKTHEELTAGGWQDEEAVVPIGRLVNMTELDLKTGFPRGDSGNVGDRTNSTTIVGGTLREYEFNITQAYAAPDGVQKRMILVNGQSPGPLIEANNGDTIRVIVHNQMAETSTTIHWHGIDQKNSSWMDGVVGVSQCAIPPGQTFTYDFLIVDERGTFWYHAHTSVQYTDGLYGPIVIHDPNEMVPDVDDEKIIFISDLYHTYGETLLKSYLQPGSEWSPDISGVEPLADNFLMNGQNTFNCSVHSTTWPEDLPGFFDVANNSSSSSSSSSSSPSSSSPSRPSSHCTGGQRYRTVVCAGARVRLRLINASSFMSFWFRIDGHAGLTVVELDGVEVEPLAGQPGVYLNIGQRVSVVVDAAATKPGNYLMRASLPRSCFLPYATYTSAGLEQSAAYEVVGILAYEGVGADEPPVDTDTGTGGPGAGQAAGEGEADGGQTNATTAVATTAITTNPFGADDNPMRGSLVEGCDDMPFDWPVPMRKEAAYEVGPGNSHSVFFQFQQAGEVNRIFINRTSWAVLHDDAQIWQCLNQDFEPGQGGSYNNWGFPLDQQVLLIPDSNQGVQVVITSRDNMEHPFHLHGHSFQVVGWGPGEFLPGDDSTTTWNLENPMRRDTVTVPALTHIVIRFMADNPGVWAMHCHVAWHMEGGMLVTFIERPDDLKRLVDDMDSTTRQLARSFCGRGLEV